ncbi:kinesin light chain 3 [Lojkania enalia]|uniref:Kinesin light chain 3 n=1 Tax=Lojkania enalia TaxID=147567 RepID=A0A9P4KB14_9PLEO|nr:kinesin light chain 3 [Didymosphaeria enalia]
MRLLHFNTSKRLVSTDFRGKTVPPYAILSHRWGDSEVLFEDLEHDTYEEKTDGYRKIKFCAKQAAQDQLQYFWVDTCCIDKWNVNELSMSINSMFRWYKNATKCYVFLTDVSVPAGTQAQQQGAWEASFRASTWFIRGWTLQELIAPVSVEFYSLEGWSIGDKQSLKSLLYEITDIPVKALENCPLNEFTRLERLEWARKRITTEPEDKVYCLLGILDIFMPAAYSEGVDTAWRRLQVELDAASDAPSIIPFHQNSHFVGRELEISKLESQLFDGTKTTRVAIIGPDGIGKSQLTLEIAYRIQERNKNCSIFWIDASNIDSIYRSYAGIAQKLRIPGWDDEKADSRQLVKAHLSRRRERQCLLIFDSLESMSLGSSGMSARNAHVIDYLPQSELCSVIFTTTNSDTAKTLASQNILELKEMTTDTAKKMLEKYLDTPIPSCELLEAESLLQDLSYHPLAIAQAATYINIRKFMLQEYRLQLVMQKDEFPSSSRFAEDRAQGHYNTCPVATTLLISLNHIRCCNTIAADYLFLAACVDRKDISLDLLKASSPRERECAVKILSSYALVTRRPAESALNLHQLVHRALREWLQKQGRLDQWTQHAITQLLGVFPDNNHSSRSKWRRLLPHAQYALSHSLVEQQVEDRLILVWKCAMTLQSDGRYDESEKLFVQVMETFKTKLGAEHTDTLSSMGNLASTYRNQGRWKEAEELEVQVMRSCKMKLGADHPKTLTSMANLVTTYWNQGQWKEAEELEVQVIETRKTKLGTDHPDTLTSMNNLASTYRDQGRYKEAEEIGVRVIENRKTKLGVNHPDTLNSMNNLASTYSNQERWKEAEELFIQVMEISKTKLGADHPNTMTSMGNLASTYRNQGRWKEAEELEVQVMKSCKMRLGVDHPDTLASMANLASTYQDQRRWKEAESFMANLAATYWNQGQWKEAEELEVQVMETRKTKLGAGHPETLTSINNLASMHFSQGLWKAAESLFMQVIEGRKTKLGADHPDTLSSMANLAATYWNQGQWEEAEDLEMQVIKSCKMKLGVDHPDTLNSMNNLASTYSNQERWKKAEELFTQNQEQWKEAEELEVQLVKGRKTKLGANHPDTLSSMANLAATYRSQERWKKVEELFLQVIETRKTKLGSDHPDTLANMTDLASTYWVQGRWKEAEELFVQVMETRKTKLGADHPDTLSSIDNLAFTFKGQGDIIKGISLMQHCYRIRKEVLGPHHPHTVSSQEALAAWQLEAMDFNE